MPDDPYGTFKELDPGEVTEAGQRLKKRTRRAEPAPAAATPPRPAKSGAEPTPAAANLPTKSTVVKGLNARSLPDLTRRLLLSDEARALLRDDLATVTYLHLLMKRQLYPDAIRLVAHGMAKQEAVWWACRCARVVAAKKMPPPVAAALEAAEKWVADPSEANRRAAMPAAEAAGLSTPAGCAALAAFWSSGSLSAPHLPVVPPGDDFTPRAAANGVLMAGTLAAEKGPDRYFEFITDGIKIAMGLNRWDEAGAGDRGR
jgi:hypothetical protein